ncbi:hypothetical protein RJ639_033317 [Escallonia herrerae]|uniref:Pentatricopeptide repeat-containing protein n=1 Tax=Escallonia herrerae TaxID=1293975 RepID=A0AA88WUL8_9ASTE|nr:hypothetical protein RJ639_033317 [Escallonia herrerae]
MDFTHLIRSFAYTRSVLRGIAARCRLITSGFHPDVYLNNHLITILIVTEGFEPNQYTYVSALTACNSIGDSRTGKEILGRIFRLQQDLNSFVSNCLVNLYGKSGLLKSARAVFDTMLEPNHVSWASHISCSCQCGENLEGLKIFLRSRNARVRVNEVCCATVLGACTALEYLKLGKQLHSLAIKCGIRMDQFVVTGLVNFYVNFGLLLQSGFLEGSLRTFGEMDAQDAVTWNTLIAGHVYSGLYQEAVELLRSMILEGFDLNFYTHSCILSICGDLPAHGFGREALEIYDMMPADGVEPNDITFFGVLSACGHVGLLEEGLCHFESMTKDYEIAPRADHLAYKAVWRCLLSNCKAHKDLELGKIAAENILRTDPDDTLAQIVLSNSYAESKMWNETADIRRLIKEKTLKKDPGYSRTELKNNLYSFSAGHNVHRQGNNVPEVLNGLTAQLYDEGYAPDAMLVSQNEE